MKKFLYLLALWFILSVLSFSVAGCLLTIPSTIANVLGISIVIVVIVLSIETKCLTIFRKKEK